MPTEEEWSEQAIALCKRGRRRSVKGILQKFQNRVTIVVHCSFCSLSTTLYEIKDDGHRVSHSRAGSSYDSNWPLNLGVRTHARETPRLPSGYAAMVKRSLYSTQNTPLQMIERDSHVPQTELTSCQWGHNCKRDLNSSDLTFQLGKT